MSQMLSMAEIVAVFMIAAACKLLEMKLCCLEASTYQGLPVDRSEGSDLEMMTKLMKASHRAGSPRLLTRMMRWRLEEV